MVKERALEPKNGAEVIELGEEQQLGVFLMSNILCPQIKNLARLKGGEAVRMIDYGCGDGENTAALKGSFGHFFDLDKVAIDMVGYDPNLARALENNHKSKMNKESDSGVKLVSKLPEQHFDIALCLFSLHHVEGDNSMTDIIKDIVDRLQPVYLMIIEADYTDKDISLAEAVDSITSTPVGRFELHDFIDKAGGDERQGKENCFTYHRRFSLADYISALKAAGYEVEKIVKGNCKMEHQKYKFIISAKRQTDNRL